MAFNTRDIVHTTTADVTGFVSGSTLVNSKLGNCYSGSTWDGLVGSTGYTVGDIVTALKRIGVLAE